MRRTIHFDVEDVDQETLAALLKLIDVVVEAAGGRVLPVAEKPTLEVVE